MGVVMLKSLVPITLKNSTTWDLTTFSMLLTAVTPFSSAWADLLKGDRSDFGD